MTTIFFFYGLSFIVMGVLIFTMPKRQDLLDLSDDLWLLGLFGISHGVNEWLDMLILIGKPFNAAALRSIGNILLPLSFLFLLGFAVAIILRVSPKSRWPKTVLVILAVAWIVPYAVARDSEIAGIAARYFIAFPAGILSCFGLFLVLEKHIAKNLPLTVKLSLVMTACGVAAYGI